MATFAETMLAKYETLMAASAGLDTVSVDGQSVRFSLRPGPHTERLAARVASPGRLTTHGGLPPPTE